MSDTCCPDCGSKNAISKADAWDALHSIPTKAAEELADLREIAAVAASVIVGGVVYSYQKEPKTEVSTETLQHLVKRLGHRIPEHVLNEPRMGVLRG